jgi:HD domain
LNLRPGSVWRKTVRLGRALSPALARPDDAWAAARLPEPELGVYRRMDPRDREHAVRVARTLLERHPNAGGEVVRAALLHDCGKLVRPYRLLERVWIGMLAPEGPRTAARASVTGSLTAIGVRNHHPQIGADLILEAGGHPRVAEIVRRHHRPDGDLEAEWIHAIDDLE